MVQGLASLRSKMTKRIPDAVRSAVAEKMEDRAQRIVQIMVHRSPKDEHNLVRSIGWTWGDAPKGAVSLGTVGGRQYRTMRITIYAGDASTMVTNSRGVEFQNAFLQEFGTQNMPPTPFFFPTWRQQKRGAKSALTRAAKKAIRGGAR